MNAPEPRIVHADDALAVIEKPAGLVVHPAPSHSGPTLVDLLGDLLGGGADPERPGIVHRLDRGTSGLLVVARTEDAHRALQEAVRERRVERVYLARADRASLPPAPPDGRLRRRLARGAHPLRGARAARRRELRRGEAGDRAHPPDPGALRRDRPPAGGRRRLRGAGTSRARTPVPPRPPARLRPPRQRRAARVPLRAP